MNKLLSYIKGDKSIWFVILLLSIFSILTVYSSIVTLAYKHWDGDTLHFLFKHSRSIGFGLLIVFFVHKVRYTYFSGIAKLLLYISVPLLVLTLIVGVNLNDASRWLRIPGLGLTFQTSDLAKLGLIMYLARLLSLKQDYIKDFQKAFLPAIIPVIIICGLILPANLSTAAVLFTSSIVLMFIGNIDAKYIFSTIGIGVVGLMLIISTATLFPTVFPRAETWVNRVVNFQDNNNKTANYQAEQSKIAIASGGIYGKGPGNSTQRNFLPHPYSDFIYAIVLEEYGFIGGVFVLMLYMILLFRCVRIVISCERTFGALLVIGLCFNLVFQGLINMAVAVNLLPVTGQTLPMMSMGNTSIVFTCIALGIILSVSAEVNGEVNDGKNKLKNAKA